jgi:hypothetical protein
MHTRAQFMHACMSLPNEAFFLQEESSCMHVDCQKKALHFNYYQVISRALLRGFLKQNFKVKCESANTKVIT